MKLPLQLPPDPDCISRRVKALRVQQPIGEIFLAVIDYDLLEKITFFDVRRVLRDTRDVEAYLGIQRPLSESRVSDLERYVNYADATFPTSIILAIDDPDYVSYNEKNFTLTLSNVRDGEEKPDINFSNLCRVIDGQHRIAGLAKFAGPKFQIMAAIFVGIDIADQAYIFATVNLEQTKVRKSLAFDLFELAKTRSPFKTCHNVAVALDRTEGSPFYQRIKRLGTSTPGRETETITQSNFVDRLIPYISEDPKGDRDWLLRGRQLELADANTLIKLCLRNLFIQGDDLAVARLVQAYFEAVRTRWPRAWDDFGQGIMLNKTNGFRALMGMFGRAYLYFAKPGDMVDPKKFLELFKRSKLKDTDFTVENFKPGSSGEAKLKNTLLEEIFG
jgi:DGQHR domain-containing protein